jgi:hypothetical protein
VLAQLLRTTLANDARATHATASDLTVHLEVVDRALDTCARKKGRGNATSDNDTSHPTDTRRKLTFAPLLLFRIGRGRRENRVGVRVESEGDEHALVRSRRQRADEDGDGESEGAEDDADGPVATADASDLESRASKVDDERLTADH